MLTVILILNIIAGSFLGWIRQIPSISRQPTLYHVFGVLGTAVVIANFWLLCQQLAVPVDDSDPLGIYSLNADLMLLFGFLLFMNIIFYHMVKYFSKKS